MTVGELKKLLTLSKNSQKVIFEIHEDGKAVNESYTVDRVVDGNGFLILISEE